MEMPCSALFRIFWTFRRVAGVRCLLTKLCKVPFRSIPEQTNTEYPWCCMFSECGNQILWRFFGKYNTALQKKVPFCSRDLSIHPPTKHIKALSVSWQSINSGSLESCWCKLTQTLYVCVCLGVGSWQEASFQLLSIDISHDPYSYVYFVEIIIIISKT